MHGHQVITKDVFRSSLKMFSNEKTKDITYPSQGFLNIFFMFVLILMSIFMIILLHIFNIIDTQDFLTGEDILLTRKTYLSTMNIPLIFLKNE